MTPAGLSTTPTSVTLTAGDNAEIKATITPDTAPQTVTDNTSLRGGGGYELANLYPRVTGLPKTVGANPGITVTETTPGTYHFKGSTTTEAGSWNNLTSSVHLDAGTYTIEASDFPYGPNSWNFGIQATLRPDDGGESITFGPKNYGPKTLPAGTFDTNIFVNTIGDMDVLITPRLYKID